MIRIHKPATPPTILVTKGQAACDALCADYEEKKQNFETHDFNSSIYGHSHVKEALIEAQHGKCCFCESKVFEDGDVEHFRPKSASKQGSHERVVRPGYYWLAYNWVNLFLCCSTCNSRYKGILFPLIDPQRRALWHKDDVRNEEPLLIDPSQDEPTEHIRFDRYDACPVNDSLRGKETIRILKLNRRQIRDRRFDRWQAIQKFLMILLRKDLLVRTSEGRAIIIEIENQLNEWKRDNAEFTAMTRAAILDGLRGSDS